MTPTATQQPPPPPPLLTTVADVTRPPNPRARRHPQAALVLLLHHALGQTVLAADQGRQPTLEPQAGRRSEPRSTDLRGQRLDELGVGPSAE
jgi:hypothetical protein